MTLRPLAAFLSSVLMLPALAQDGSAVTGKIDAMYPKLDAIYKDLHAHPEVAFQEVRTAAKLCLLYTSPSPRDGLLSRMPSSA